MTKPFTTGFLIFPGFPMACLTSMIEPLRAANEISGKDAFEWRLISEIPGKVASSAMVEFDPGGTIQDATGIDLLILLSAPTAQFARQVSAGQLRRLQRHGTVLGGVSGGVFPLARAGLAGGTPIAVHWCYEAAFAAEFPDHKSSDRVIEISSTLVSAAGASAGFDLSLHLIEQRLGAGLATEVACWFQHPVMRREGVSQIVPTLSGDQSGTQLSPLVERAVRIFAANLDEPVSISEIADRLRISPRHLERSFKQSTGLNPTQYYRKLRMDAARQMILYTNERVADISAAVGYSAVQTFAKHYEATFSLSPKADRARINLFRVKGNLSVPST